MATRFNSVMEKQMLVSLCRGIRTLFILSYSYKQIAVCCNRILCPPKRLLIVILLVFLCSGKLGSFSIKFRICLNVRSDLYFFPMTLFTADIYFLQTRSDLFVSGVHM